MAAARKSPKKPRPATNIAFEDMTPSAQMAYELLTEYGDLAPSIEKIMNAELSEPQRLTAITAFRSSLGAIDDPFRDPRYAIAHCGPA
jgi:hypothetical protein